MPPAYPFVPKSRIHLRPGQFWSIPLSGGRFACGRVLQTTREALPNSRAFFGALHEWIGTDPPTSDAIAGRALVDFGVMHIKAIAEAGGQVLGERPLDADELVAPLLMSALGGPGVALLRGAQRLRPARRDEWGKYPVLRYLGYDSLRSVAERRLAGNGGDAA